MASVLFPDYCLKYVNHKCFLPGVMFYNYTNMRRQYWDILKGLGIIAVVIGHSGSPLAPFVYMYHIALFFFISGFFYKDIYSTDTTMYVAVKLKRLYWPFVKYNFLFLIFHNLLLYFNLYSAEQLPGAITTTGYSVEQTLAAAQAILLLSATEQMAVATWFLIPLFITSILFCLIRSASIRVFPKYSLVYTALAVISLYAIGFLIVGNKIKVAWFIDLSLIYLPIFFSGFIVSNYKGKLTVHWGIALLAIITLIFISRKYGQIEPFGRRLLNPWLFLLCSFAGIYVNSFLGRLLEQRRKIGKIIAYLGESSLIIMAFHMLSFKLVSYIYILASGSPTNMLAQFPAIKLKGGWWIAYSIVGISVPGLLNKFLDVMKERFK